MRKRTLQEFVDETGAGKHLRVEHDYGDGFVRLRTSEAERRQAAQDIRCSEDIVIELLRNSRDAHATHIFMAVSKEGSQRSIVVVDDGDGIPESMHHLVFEPRVTSKLDTSHLDAWGLHGRGMALYSISENALFAEVVNSAPGLGCAMAIRTETATLPEKTDQSSFPRFEMAESGQVHVRGPRNILRTACEFAIQERDSRSVYVGSPAEIVSTMYEYGMRMLSDLDKAFCKDADSLPLAKRLATAGDPLDLSEMASSMGLDISVRTARRIMDGQIPVTISLLDQVRIERNDGSESTEGKRTAKKGRGKRRRAKVSISKDDLGVLQDSLKSAFGEVADRYYLEADVEISARNNPDTITLSIPIVKKE